MTPARRAILLAATLLLAACATQPVGTDGLSFEARRRALEQIDAWEMRGRLAVDTGERAFQGRFDWRQEADSLDLAVRNPLGAGVLRVAGAPAELTVTARGETRTLSNPEVELSELLGWWLPVGSLSAWLLGLPDRAFAAVTETGADGTLAGLEQRLWHVTYPTYQIAQTPTAPGGLLLPRRIDLEHGALKLRLTVDAWQPVSAQTSP